MEVIYKCKRCGREEKTEKDMFSGMYMRSGAEPGKDVYLCGGWEGCATTFQKWFYGPKRRRERSEKKRSRC